MLSKDLLTDAVREHLYRSAGESSRDEAATSPPWIKAFGGLRSLHKETKRINRILKQEFEQIEEDEWR